MKCIASFVLLTFNLIATTLAATLITSYKNSDSFIYDLYNDNTATLTRTTTSSFEQFTVPANVNYKGKNYKVTKIAGYAFQNVSVKKVSINSSNSNLTIQKNAFNGVKNLKEFNFNSKNTKPEIDAFKGAPENVLFKGSYVKNAFDYTVKKYLNKWSLPVGKNYSNISEYDRLKDLFTLAKKMQQTFRNDGNGTYKEYPAAVLYIGKGSRGGVARLYKAFANMMGVSAEEVLVGCDQINFCWSYVKADLYDGRKVWRVADLSQYIDSNEEMSIAYFQRESYFISNTLEKYYKYDIYDLNPENFIVKFDMFLGSDNQPTSYNFSYWINKRGGNSELERTYGYNNHYY